MSRLDISFLLLRGNGGTLFKDRPLLDRVHGVCFNDIGFDGVDREGCDLEVIHFRNFLLNRKLKILE
jgi:hypothetical protein